MRRLINWTLAFTVAFAALLTPSTWASRSTQKAEVTDQFSVKIGDIGRCTTDCGPCGTTC